MVPAMPDDAPAQSMDDILASIRRVISADAAAARRLPPVPAADDDVLELGEPPLVSPRAEQASRAALASLSGMSVDPNAPAGTLDGLVRELMRPLLKQWLDDNLPQLVERVVAREVARIVGR